MCIRDRTYTDGARDNELQQMLRMAKHQTNEEALVHALQFQASKSASGWVSHKDRDAQMMKKSKEQTQRVVPQNKLRKDGRPELSLIHI